VHFHHNPVLGEFIPREDRDHHWIFRAGVVGKNEENEVGDADQSYGKKSASVSQVHGLLPIEGLLKSYQPGCFPSFRIGDGWQYSIALEEGLALQQCWKHGASIKQIRLPGLFCSIILTQEETSMPNPDSKTHIVNDHAI